jgi:putative ABC transport system permease protein
VSDLLILLNKDHMKWVIVPFVVACPIGWFAMNIWLQDFAYPTEISWCTFAGSGLATMAVALLTVSLQIWRAGTTNPGEALRDE